jgi:hypothetical protein
MRTAVGLFGHERPFEAGRKSGAAAPALSRCLDFIDDGVAAARQNCFGVIPSATAARTVEGPIVLAIQIFENAIFIGEH